MNKILSLVGSALILSSTMIAAETAAPAPVSTVVPATDAPAKHVKPKRAKHSKKMKKAKTVAPVATTETAK